MTPRITRAALSTIVAAVSLAVSARADVIALDPSKDNTLYENGSGETSNGQGPTMFVGRTFQGFEDLRRALLAFDLSAIPPGSTITSVQLTLYLSKTPLGAFDTPVSLHQVGADWGEGASAADPNGGFGVPAAPGDATWLHTFHDASFWVMPGGDFDGTASAATTVNSTGSYTWGSTPGMVADAQAWLDDPGSNFGWVLVGDESRIGSARRFNTREYPESETRPVLTITYDPPVIPVRETTWSRIKATY